MTELSLTLKGMRCEGCERAVETALARIDGVLSASADRKTERVDVRFMEGRANEPAILERIELCGYRVKP